MIDTPLYTSTSVLEVPHILHLLGGLHRRYDEWPKQLRVTFDDLILQVHTTLQMRHEACRVGRGPDGLLIITYHVRHGIISPPLPSP